MSMLKIWQQEWAANIYGRVKNCNNKGQPIFMGMLKNCNNNGLATFMGMLKTTLNL